MKKEKEAENGKTEAEKKDDMRKEVFSWIRMFVIVIAVVFVLTQFIIINVRVPSGSMENTIMTKDRLIGFRFSYWFDEPQRGDIILFSYPVTAKLLECTGSLRDRYAAAWEVLKYLGVLVLLFLCVCSLAGAAYNPFIYFRF